MTEVSGMPDDPKTLPPIKIAFILDGVVQDVLHTDERLAAIFLSQPLVVDVSHEYGDDPTKNLTNYTYDGEAFTPPIA